jgi:parallel beta-helix repeat protein
MLDNRRRHFEMRPKGNLHKSLFPIFTFFVLLGVSPGFATATDFYVATNGADSNPGTEASPFQTIQKGVSALSPGDTLFVKAGTYEESILSWTTIIPNGEDWNKPITVKTHKEDSVIIHPRAGQAFFWIKEPQAKYLIIDGFTVDGRNQAWHGFKFHGGATHIRIQNTEIKNTTASGILVAGPGAFNGAPPDTYHEFINVHAHHNGTHVGDHGFYIETGRNLVEGGSFHHNTGNGGKFFHGNLSNVSNHNIARNNSFYQNSTSGGWSCGLLLSSGDGTMAYNNTAYGNFAGFCILMRVSNARLFNNIAYENMHYGIYVGKTTTDRSYVENNTVYNNNGYGIFVGEGAKNTTVINNISYLNKFDNIGLKDQTGTIISHNLTSNPMFENAPANDFKLKPESPAIDQGATINLITKDFAGNPRPQGADFDIGAYEKMPEAGGNPPNTPANLRIVKQ